ncbi:MAG: TetR/AcrR family transcriptional regulator [Chloroflexota bacterium]
MPLDPIQEQLIQARRNQILDAATSAFAQKGYHRATIQDVAKIAGIAAGTIYNYFENKTALLMGILERLNETERRDDDMSQIMKMDIHTFSQHYMRRRFELMMQNGFEIFQIVLSEVLIDSDLRAIYMAQVIEPTFALAENYYLQAVGGGKIRSDIDIPLTLRLTSAAVIGILVLRILGDTEIADKWEQIPDLLTTMTLDGILPPKGDDEP